MSSPRLPEDEPLGLLLQFHGDGAFELENPALSCSLGGNDGIVVQARAGLLTMAVLTPDDEGAPTW